MPDNQQNNHYQLVPARHGWRWLMQAGDLIGGQLRVFALLILCWTAIAQLSLIPLLGTLLLLLITPALQAGAMLAFGKAQTRQAPEVSDLWQFLNSPQRGALLSLAAMLMGLVMLLLLVMGMLAGWLIPGILEVANNEELLALQVPFSKLMILLSAALLLSALISMSLFFAVARVAFSGITPLAAMQESLRACLHNWRAFVMFGIAQIVISIAGAVMLSVVLLVVGVFPAPLSGLLSAILLSVFVAAVQTLVAGGQFLAWRDVFTEPADESRNTTEQQQAPDRFIA